MDINEFKSLLRKYNFRPNFTYGQNFLLDEDILNDIVNAAAVSSADNILEIGPGLGNLTRKLCERSRFVLSIEKDPKFLPILKSVKKDYPKSFRYEIEDALEYDFQSAFCSPPLRGGVRGGWNQNYESPLLNPPPQGEEKRNYKVVANIPYYITGKILRMLLSAGHKPSSIVVLTQKEVAEQVCAKPGDLSLLAISVQIFGEPEIVRTVPSSAFYPKPKVDSAILRIQMNQQPKYEIGDEKKFFRVVKACFAGKRKQLHNTLVNNLKLDRDQVAGVLSSLGIDPKTRPQELKIEEWIGLSSKL